MESFFHTLKLELAHQQRWPTREHATRALFAYIEGYYNRRPIHSALGQDPGTGRTTNGLNSCPLKRGIISSTLYD
jgi:transposase InsO family protein